MREYEVLGSRQSPTIIRGLCCDACDATLLDNTYRNNQSMAAKQKPTKIETLSTFVGRTEAKHHVLHLYLVVPLLYSSTQEAV